MRDRPTTHGHVVLFYRYFLPTTQNGDESSNEEVGNTLDQETNDFFQSHASHFYLPRLKDYQSQLCTKTTVGGSEMKGRILISKEGINGTLSCATEKELNSYIAQMEGFDLIRDLGVPPEVDENEKGVPKPGRGRLFANIDWKKSTISNGSTCDKLGQEQQPKQLRPFKQPFPDLKIQIVNEIINTGGLIHVNDIPTQSGKEISPEEFHSILMEACENDGGVEVEVDDGDSGVNGDTSEPPSKKVKIDEASNKATNSKQNKKKKEVVLIDVRNTFEHAIGHFVHPHSGALQETSASSALIGSEKESEPNENGANGNVETNTNEASELTSESKEPIPALNPNTLTFSHFSSTFVTPNLPTLKDKKVLMYCTGGIRCVKASAMLTQNGITDVSHLKGGIHRYLEKYGEKGFYKGKMFVFDERVSLDPEEMRLENENHAGGDLEGGGGDGLPQEQGQRSSNGGRSSNIVGKCIECQSPYDQLSGANLCTVCRDLVLVCTRCQNRGDINSLEGGDNDTANESKCDSSYSSPSSTISSDHLPLFEYHCEKHQPWKHAFFTFLERFTVDELKTQHSELQKIHDAYISAKEPKNKICQRKNYNNAGNDSSNNMNEEKSKSLVNEREEMNKHEGPSEHNQTKNKFKNLRKTLRKQMEKVQSRIRDLEEGTVFVDKKARRRCRTCFEPNDVCDGLCWGFWKHSQSPLVSGSVESLQVEPIVDVKVGDRVSPGPDWNEMRFGSRYYPTPNSSKTSRKRFRNVSNGANCTIGEEDISSDLIQKIGSVVEVKSWGSDGNELDCVAVIWDDDPHSVNSNSTDDNADASVVLNGSGGGMASCQVKQFRSKQSEIYRYGALARNGRRMYDVKLVVR